MKSPHYAKPIQPIDYVLHAFTNRALLKLVYFMVLFYALLFLLYSYYSVTNVSDYSIHTLSSDEPDRPSNIHVSPYAFDPEYGVKLVIERKENYQFDWKHWVNLTDLTPTPEHFKFATYVSSPYDEPPPRPGTTAELRRIGQTFLNEYAPPVSKIILLGRKKTAVIRPPELPRQLFIGHSSKVNTNATENSYEDDMYEVMSAVEGQDLLPPLTAMISSDSMSDRIVVDTPASWFTLSVATDRSNIESQYHANFVEHTIGTMKDTPKYFKELSLSKNKIGGTHYDWRFYKQFRKGKDKLDTLHHLVRTWAAFTQQEGIVSWIAHGALMGWYWNGLTLPWDNDFDVQMPAMELDRIARKYNNTLIVQDPKEGSGRYILDVSPEYVQRIHGNGANVIDARFIDVRSGLYLDITGLAFNHPKNSKLLGCKSPHYYKLEDISPLHLTTFEGTQLYIPNNFMKLLRDEYKHFDSPRFEKHAYNKDLRLWMGRSQCKSFRDDDLKYSKATGDLTLYGACNDQQAWAVYNKTRDLTSLHEDEINYFQQHKNVKNLIKSYPEKLIGFATKVEPFFNEPRYIEIHETDI